MAQTAKQSKEELAIASERVTEAGTLSPANKQHTALAAVWAERWADENSLVPR